jgi:hypothetical protein
MAISSRHHQWDAFSATMSWRPTVRRLDADQVCRDPIPTTSLSPLDHSSKAEIDFSPPTPPHVRTACRSTADQESLQAPPYPHGHFMGTLSVDASAGHPRRDDFIETRRGAFALPFLGAIPSSKERAKLPLAASTRRRVSHSLHGTPIDFNASTKDPD